ncbi:MAG: sigma-70 family RNA polymerase sigma factor [Pseudomonadota bacterium]
MGEGGQPLGRISGTEDRDRVLIRDVAEGDKTAMRAVYEAHAAAVHRFVSVRLRDQFEAADIVHETMLCVWRDAARFKGHGSVRSWILALARHKVIDHLRKHSRTEICEPDERVPADDPHADDVIAAAQDARRVRACVAKLPAAQRAVVHLAFFEDLSYAEISAIEGIPEGTVKTRIFHAKKCLLRNLSRSSATLNADHRRPNPA